MSVTLKIEFDDLTLIRTALRYTEHATASPMWAAKYGELADMLDAAAETAGAIRQPRDITYEE